MCLGASSPFMQENCRASCGWCTQAKKDVCYQKGEVRRLEYSADNRERRSAHCKHCTTTVNATTYSIRVFRDYDCTIINVDSLQVIKIPAEKVVVNSIRYSFDKVGH